MRAILAVAAMAVLAGCSTLAYRDHPGSANMTNDQRHWGNSWMVTSLQEQTIQNAVLRQRTIFPYHFVTGSAELNALGERDLAMLADHLRMHPGQLDVRQDDVGKDLYQERVASVRAFLEREGVSMADVCIDDTHAGGDGMSSEQVIEVLKKSRSDKAGTGASEGGSGTGVGMK